MTTYTTVTVGMQCTLSKITYSVYPSTPSMWLHHWCASKPLFAFNTDGQFHDL